MWAGTTQRCTTSWGRGASQKLDTLGGRCAGSGRFLENKLRRGRGAASRAWDSSSPVNKCSLRTKEEEKAGEGQLASPARQRQENFVWRQDSGFPHLHVHLWAQRTGGGDT